MGQCNVSSCLKRSELTRCRFLLQIAMRRMVDTSPASLPHESDPPLSTHVPSSSSSTSASHSSEPITSSTLASTSTSSSAKRGHTRTPSLPAYGLAENIFARRTTSQTLRQESDEQGGTIVGRAVNIANTAKDLLGALWSYGSQQDAQQTRSQESKRGDDVSRGKKTGR